jgi:hypothetical protein
MKMEFLREGSSDRGLIRLFSFTPVEAGELHACLVKLASSRDMSPRLEELPFVEAMDRCEFKLLSGKKDRGIHRTGPFALECVCRAVGWDVMAWRSDPFRQTAAGGFQWLWDRGRIRLLLSVDGNC